MCVCVCVCVCVCRDDVDRIFEEGDEEKEVDQVEGMTVRRRGGRGEKAEATDTAAQESAASSPDGGAVGRREPLLWFGLPTQALRSARHESHLALEDALRLAELLRDLKACAAQLDNLE